MSRHLLVTNDFPPKLGGIQQYLWELWRRLDPATFEVHTPPYEGAEAFDAEQAFTINRSTEPVLLPYPWLTKRLNEAAEAFDASLHVIDPAVPLAARFGVVARQWKQFAIADRNKLIGVFA